MQFSIIIAALGLFMGADACYVRCRSGEVIDVQSDTIACPGEQEYVFAAAGFADIVHFDGGKPHACVDGEGFSLKHIAQNIIGCDNFVRGTCCGHDRC